MEEIITTMRKFMSDIARNQKNDISMLKTCPEGDLKRWESGSGSRLYRVTSLDGKRVRETITGNEELQTLLARRAILEKRIQNSKRIYSEIDKIIKEIKPLCEIDYYMLCRELFPWMDKDKISSVFAMNIEADAWANEPYEKLTWKPEQKTKLTSKGEYVRSKSEAIIAEKLIGTPLPFRYEEVIHVGQEVLVPDFTIRRADGKIFYWEHMGLMNNATYIERQYQKEALYRSIEIVPWDNLIKTYDTPNGDIDIRIIESEIRNKLLL